MNPLKFYRIIAVLLVLFPSIGWSSGGVALPHEEWSFMGIFGRYNRPALKRGAQVAVEVCLACHAIKYIKFDHLRQIGFSEAEIQKLADSQSKSKVDFMLSAMDADSAKDAFGVVPPDLSLITKARKGYENYTYALLTGYVSDEESKLVEKALADDSLSETELKELSSALLLDAHHPEKVIETAKRIAKGENFNKYFPGNFFAMPNPLSAGQVTYGDGTENSVKQMSKDVVTFLSWAAEPTIEERKSTGVMVEIYLLILTVMLYAIKRRVWSKVSH